MTTEPRMRRPWWIGTAVTAALVIAVAGLIVGIASLSELVRLSGNALKDGDPAPIRIFLTTYGSRSPVAAALLIAWQAILVPLPFESALRAAAHMFGPLVGGLAAWVGLVAGACAVFGIARGLLGLPIARARTAAAAPTGVGLWLLLGLRLVPLLPQDVVSIVCGTTRLRFRTFLSATVIGALPAVVFFSIYADSLPQGSLSAYMRVSAALGVVILVVLAWRHRGELPFGTLSPSRKRQLAGGVAMVGAVLLVYVAVPGVRSWVNEAASRMAAGDVAAIKDYIRSFGVWAPAVSALLMVLQSVLAPLPAFIITFANGLLFGVWWGALLSWSSAMAGAALCFFIARSLGRPAVEKLAGGSATVASADRFFERFGRKAVLIARLLPFVSFDIVSYAAGLTSMRFWPFFIATGIGQLPATLAYSYLGQNMTSSIRVVFFSFVVFAAILVGVASARPAFEHWLNRGSDAAA